MKDRPTRLPIHTAALLLAVFLSGRTAHAFTLKEAWEAAKQHSADIQAARHLSNAAQEQQNQAKAALLPQLTAHAAYQRQPPSLSATRETQSADIRLSQTLFDAGKTARYRQSKHHSRAAQSQYEADTEELLVQVAETYFQLLLSKDTIAAHASEKAAYAQQIKQAREMFKRGAATALDIHEAQAGYDRALAQEIAAIAQKQIQENRLNDQTGLDSGAASPVDTANLTARYLPKLQQHTLEQWQQLALSRNHGYQTQSHTLNSSKEALKAAQNSRLPTLNANIGYQSNRYTAAQQNHGYRHHGKGMTIGVQLNMPLYSGGEISSRIREAREQYLQAQARLAATERQVKLAVRQAHTEGSAAYYQILAQERVLKSSRLKLKSTETGQRHGLRNSLEVIRARQEVAQAEQQLAQANYAFLMAYLKLVKESGLGVENALER